MKRKLVSLFVTFGMAITLLAGCGSNSDSSGQTSLPASEEASDQTNTNPDEVVVRFMCFGTVPTDLQLVEDAINEITIPEINVKVTYESISASNYGTQLALDMTSGEKVDVFFNFDFVNSVDNNQLLDLTDYLDTYGQELVAAVSEDWLKATTVNGRVYGLPIVNGKAASLMLAMRTDILEKYDLVDLFNSIEVSENILDDNAAHTLEVMTQIFEVVKENEPELIGLCAGGAGTMNLEKMVGYDSLSDGNGVLMNDGGWTVENFYKTDEFKAVITQLNNWYKAGYIKSDITTDTESYTSYATAGRMFALMLESDETMGISLQRDSGYEYSTVRLMTPSVDSSKLNGQTWCVSSTTDVPEAAVKFLNLAYSNADIANLMCYGVEGVHWEYQEDGTIDYVEGLDATTSGYSMSTYWEMPNTLIAACLSGNGADYNQKLLEQNKTVKASKALGFSFDSSKVETELTAISAVGSQNMTGFLTGGGNLTEYDTFIEKLQKAGIDDVIAEKQRQVDEWRADNGVE